MENICCIAINYLTYLVLNNRKLDNKHEHPKYLHEGHISKHHTSSNEPIYQKDRYTKYDSLVSQGILCHYGDFSDGTSYEEVNKSCHG